MRMARDKVGHHEQIMAAAWQEFLTYGFADASMRRIAVAAGMSAAGLYKHFPSKEEMFSALVEPAYQGLMALYRQEEKAEREALQAGTISEKWQTGGEAALAMTYIYDHLDAFRLLICKAQGTRYETFLHDLAIEEEKTTMVMMDLMKEQGGEISNVDPKEFHLLVTANVNAVFQAVEHGFSREEALRYASTLDRFFSKGWQELFGY
jgi:AcrR family transcriptional regulator